MTLEPGKAGPTTKQEKEYLLCEPCDGTLGVYDGWGSRNVGQLDGSFPLVQRSSRDARGIILTDEDALQLSLFCLSIFWRAHASRLYQTSLGPYGDSVRDWLRDSSARKLPEEVVLVTSFIEGSPDDPDIIDFATTTGLARQDGFHLHTFIQFGLEVILVVGQKVPLKFRKLCIIHPAQKRLHVTQPKRVIEASSGIVAEAIRRRVKLGLQTYP